MIVQIQSADSNRETPEWALIELNGELVPPTDVPKEQTDKDDDNLVESDRMELGSLKFTPEVSASMLNGDFVVTPSFMKATHVVLGNANHYCRKS
jgi:sulfur carrier protein ThiS